MTGDDKLQRLAVLIDADNAQPSMAPYVLAEVAKYGTAFVKRAYGDWTGPQLGGWKAQLLENSIQPIQQFAYTTGKNATDAALVIDAMDLLYSGRFEGFCIVSSDSDFTRLASRIRESGLFVYGCGERKTPKPFVSACDKFIYVENLRPPKPAPVVGKRKHEEAEAPVEAGRSLDDPKHRTDLIRTAIDMTSNEEKWARLADVGNLIVKLFPDFDARTYGYRKLSDMVASVGLFELKYGGPQGVMIRNMVAPEH